MKKFRLSQMVLVVLLGLFFATTRPGGAAANSSVSTYAAYGSAIETICDGNCEKRLNLEARRQAVGFDRPFELGLKLLEDGLDLTLESDGNIFIYGTLRSSGSITLVATDLVLRDVAFELPPIVSGGTGPPFGCACVSISTGSTGGLSSAVAPRLARAESRLRGARLDLFAARTAIASVVGLDAPLGPAAGFAISRAGDLYLDLSMVELGQLTATAGKSMFIVGSDSLPVPEPGSGLLIGLGLVSLAIRRARPSAAQANLAIL